MQGFKNITTQGVKLQISRGGRVYYNGKELKAHKQGKYAIICAGGKRFSVHRLVAQAWLNKGEELPKGCEVHHINNLASDNRVSNLTICRTLWYYDYDYPSMAVANVEIL
jgi:hypothetical protein